MTPDPQIAALAKHEGQHKYNHGAALVLTGGMGRTGAARLAARGALRIGAGVVTLGAPGSAMLECACQITALMLRRIDDAAALVEALEDQRINALCLGPGMGIDRAAALLPVALASGRALVLDADALTALSPLTLPLPAPCVLTPHAGEFRRLFPDLPAEGTRDTRLASVRAAAARAGCVVLLKGPETQIAAPGGHHASHIATGERAVPWLATAGAGDVLAGFITGLLARGVAPFEAAQLATRLHADCARAIGPGLIAEDLPEALPGVLRGLLAPQ